MLKIQTGAKERAEIMQSYKQLELAKRSINKINIIKHLLLAKQYSERIIKEIKHEVGKHIINIYWLKVDLPQKVKAIELLKKEDKEELAILIVYDERIDWIISEIEKEGSETDITQAISRLKTSLLRIFDIITNIEREKTENNQ